MKGQVLRNGASGDELDEKGAFVEFNDPFTDEPHRLFLTAEYLDNICRTWVRQRLGIDLFLPPRKREALT